MTQIPTPAARLRAMIDAGTLVRAPGAPDALTARLVERAGFEAVYMTGFGATAARLGLPDIGLMSQTEMTGHARDMVRATALPVIADADTGYGGIANLIRTVEEYAQSGVAAIHLEDQQMPKRCGQRAGVRVIPAEENLRRLHCAVEARGSSDMMIIARTDALGAHGIDEAIRRANLYRDAGVDLVFVDGIKQIADVEAVARGVPGPKVVSIVDGNETVALRTADLQEMGFSMVFYALTALFASVRAVSDVLGRLESDGTPRGVADRMVAYAEFSEIVGLERFDEADHHWG
ncbi:isocitrate lyase/PEP mutase family protein [Frigidibacter sp. MR17.24]|uniref:isocitrate lyase/PEP mutase family protein n=1 Tax=Frigidibacter sp. MR17.24 TaxID=3127345 RepID=UPI0030130E89